MRQRIQIKIVTVFLGLLPGLAGVAHADPYARPGDNLLRADLQRLNDTGVMNVPLTAWPLSYGDIDRGLKLANVEDAATFAALARVRERIGWESKSDVWRIDFGLSAAGNPRIIRSFEDTPRDDGRAFVRLNWLSDRFVINLEGSVIVDPFDGDDFRPDGTYLGVALGNWMLSAGWQERWWGPGNTGSLLLSSNARPSPGIAIQRNRSDPLKTKWLSWVGPWTFASFMNLLDDKRAVENALLFGVRFSFKPIESLEIGLSRTAQWCGDDRSCDSEAFFNMLLGKDNQGVNVDPEDEPGNQLAGFDIRWALPGQIPAAVYVQWIGEDGRDGKAIPGNWLRQAGLELWGTIGSLDHRTYFEWSDSSCRQGGLGFSEVQPNCAYDHGIFTTGYRYKQRAIGHSMDGDGLSYSLGSTLVQSAGHVWNLSLRFMEINRVGTPTAGHTLSATPQDLADIQLSHERVTPLGSFYAGIGYSRLDDEATDTTTTDVSGFVQWSSR